jgi:hypothetical protein
LNNHPSVIHAGTTLVSVALSDIEVKDPTQPIITIRVSGGAKTNNPASPLQIVPVAGETFTKAKLKQDGDLSFAIFAFHVDPQLACLESGTIEFIAQANASFKLQKLAVVLSQGYYQDVTKLPALFAGFRHKTGSRNGLSYQTGGVKGVAQFGPYSGVRQKTPMSFRINTDPQRNSRCPLTNYFETSPASGSDSTLVAALLTGGAYRLVADSKPVKISSTFSQRGGESCRSQVAAKPNAFWRASKPISLIPQTDRGFEASITVANADANLKINSTEITSYILTYEEGLVRLKSDLMRGLFGRPEFISQYVKIASPNEYSVGFSYLSAVYFREFDGAGYAIRREDRGGGKLRYVAAVSEAHHDSGKLTPSGWEVSEASTKKNDRVYDSVLIFDKVDTQPDRSLRALVRLKKSGNAPITFDMEFLDEVSQKKDVKSYSESDLLADQNGNLWAVLDIQPQFSQAESQIRFTMRAGGGDYEIKKVVFIGAKQKNNNSLEFLKPVFDEIFEGSGVNP